MTTAITPQPGSLADRMNKARARRQALAADWAELARLDLKANALTADIAAEGQGSDNLPALRAALAAAQQARQDALARIYGGTSQGRDERRAAVHRVRHSRAPLSTEQRDALARQLADGCTRSRWGRERTPHIRMAADHALVTERGFTRFEILTGDHRSARGVIPTYQPSIRHGQDSLTVHQDGRLIVADGVEVAERDASRDERADAIRRHAGTRVAGAVTDADYYPARFGMTGLDMWQQGQDMIAAADAAEREAEREAERAALAAEREAREVERRRNLAAAGLNAWTV